MDDSVLLTLEYDKILVALGKHCESDLAKRMVTRLRPIDKVSELGKLQEETEEAIRMILAHGNPPLFGIHEIKSAAKRAGLSGILSPGQLLEIAESLRVSRALVDYAAEADTSALKALIDSLFLFKPLEDMIFNAILSEEEISDTASSALFRIRKSIQSKESQIKTKLNSIMASAAQAGHLRENLITLREGRYVLPVKAESRRNIAGVVHDQSGSGATVFIEPLAIVNLNNEIRQLELEEQDEIQRILQTLSGEVAVYSVELSDNQDKLQYIDFTFAKGKYALSIKGVRPVLSEERVCDIRQARHPLLGKNVVPINLELGENFNSLIITGPNTGGKTVSLKTLGLLTLMAQSGLQIPANTPSKVGVFSNIYADIGDKQSIEMSLSTFSSSMSNIIRILDRVKETDLVLFDELGAGTDPTEGAALAMSILDYLTGRGIRTVATTHYSELKLFAIREEGVQNASVEFDVESLSPTYRLSIGLPGRSNAFEISRRLGLSEEILRKAQDHLDSENVHFEDVLSDIEVARIESEKERERIEQMRRDYEDRLKSMQAELDQARKTYQRELEKAKEEARDILSRAQATAQSVIREAKKAGSRDTRSLDRTLTGINDQIKREQGKIKPNQQTPVQRKADESLQLGEAVEIISMRQTGTIVQGPDKNGDVLVQIGILKVNSNLADLRRVQEAEENKQASSSNRIIQDRKSLQLSTELDLRGKRYEEALDMVDKYIDDAVLAGLHVVRIIHGKGTGALRKGITDFLKGDRRVKKYQLADVREGGAGVTVAELQ